MIIKKLNKSTNFSFHVSIYCLFIAIIIIFYSCLLTDGRLIYTLDDPYIHMAVSEEILKGGYGVNSHEYSSPSSSILYPFILAITEALGLDSLGPLIVNLIVMFIFSYILSLIIENYMVNGVNIVFPHQEKYILVTLILILSNTWGLALTGMEHSIHLMLNIILIYRFLSIRKQEKDIDALLLLSIIFLPFVRFEGIPLTVSSILLLIVLKRKKMAIISFSLLLILSSAWIIFLSIAELPILPSSVLLKSDIVSKTIKSSNAIFQLLLKNFIDSLQIFQGQIILLELIIIIMLFLKNKSYIKKDLSFILTWLSIPLGLAHLLFGQYGWFSRYEVYAISFLAISILIMVPNKLFTNKFNRVIIYFIIFTVGLPYVETMTFTPMASYGIYLQHYQMHRFVVDYWDKTVAVNDLGLVSYKNPNYVLDLWGLGSEEIRNLKESEKFNSEEIDNIIRRKNVQLVIIYDEWFRGIIPKQWVKVAEMKTIKVSAAYGNVSFYATKNEYVNSIYNKINEFTKTIPSRVTFDFY